MLSLVNPPIKSSNLEVVLGIPKNSVLILGFKIVVIGPQPAFLDHSPSTLQKVVTHTRNDCLPHVMCNGVIENIRVFYYYFKWGGQGKNCSSNVSRLTGISK